MYTKQSEPFGKFQKITLTGPGGDSFSVVPDFGANINELNLVTNSQSYALIDGVKTYEELIDDKAFKSTVLAPWPNRIKDGRYSFEGKEYQLPVNEPDRNNALHGFVFRKKFTVEDIALQAAAAEIRLSYEYRGDEQGYPFKFILRLRYAISAADGFSVIMEVENTDSRNIPVGIGWHPYISMPSKVDSLTLQLPQCRIHEVDRQMIPTGRLDVYDNYAIPKTIGGDQLDSCFLIDDPDAVTKTILADGSRDLKLKFWQETGTNGFNYLQVYTPNHRNSIAIEPMTCGVDVFNNEAGLTVLKPGEKTAGKFGLKLIS